MADKNLTRNPLVANSPRDTINNIEAVISFLQHQKAGEWSYEPGDEINMGELLVFETVRDAVKSLEPHLKEARVSHG